MNIIALITREIASKTGVGPKKTKELYFTKYRVKIKGKIIQCIKNDQELNRKFLKISRRFKTSEKIGRSKLGRLFEKTNASIRKRRTKFPNRATRA